MAVISDISCSLPRPDIAVLRDQLASELSRRLLGGAPVLPGSAEDVLAFVMGGAVNLTWGFVAQALKENDPANMCCDSLVKYAAQRGINLRASTRAKGYVAITGDPGATIPHNLRFVGQSSREYKLDPAVSFNPTVLDITGHAVLRVVAALGGSIFNLAAGEILTVSTTFPGIDMDGTVLGSGIGGGTEDETCDQLRQRVIQSEASGVITTNLAWYLQESAKYPGITRACSNDLEGECCCDPNLIEIYPFMDGVYGQMSQVPVQAPYGVPICEVIDSMNAWMWGPESGHGGGLAPVGIRGRYLQALPTYFEIDCYCHKGCTGIAIDRIDEAVNSYLRAATCVGSALCLEQIRAWIYRALGTDNCFSKIEFKFDETMGRQDGVFSHLNCGHFAVLRRICIYDFYSTATCKDVGTHVLPRDLRSRYPGYPMLDS